MLATVMQDLRYALRQLIRQPSFTVVAVLTLALGIGATTAIFSVMYGVLLRPLPYADPGRLVGFTKVQQGTAFEAGVTWREMAFLQERLRGLESVAAATSLGFSLDGGGHAEHVGGLRVTRDYFRVLSATPMLGRTFTADEDEPGGPATVVLSHALWQRRFGADSAVIGRTVRLDGEPAVVIGVMPASFVSLPEAELWAAMAPVRSTVGSGQNLEVIGRLRPGLSLAQVNATMGPVATDFRTEFPRDMGDGTTLALRPMQQLVVTDVATPVRLLFGAIALVLLIACANVANLLLGRAAVRSREFSVRAALGASRPRMVRQLLTESVLLALVGGALGLLVGDWMLRLLLATVPDALPRLAEVHLDRWALLFTCGLALVTGVGFGLLPALHAGRGELSSGLREGSGRTIGSVGGNRMRSGLVVLEVALSLMLLAGAGLLLRTFANLMHEDPGFDPHGLVSAEIWLTGSHLTTPEATSTFYAELERRLDALPGVTSAAVVESGLPLERGGNIAVSLDGQPLRATIDYRTVSPGYFQTIGVPVRSGRLFEPADRAGTAPVVVVSETFARRFLGDRSPLGRRLHVGGEGGVDPVVVGVVGDIRSYIGFPPPPMVFLPSSQTPADFTRVFNGWYPIHVLVRAGAQAGTLVPRLPALIHDVAADVPVGRIRTLDDVLAGSLASQRFLLELLSLFAGLAAILAAIGLYGVIAYLVTQRAREIGVRLALGAGRAEVIRLVVGRGLALGVTGVGLGLVGALALTRVLQSQLFGVQPGDPLTLVLVALLLLAVTAAASAVPALRAARLDPLATLRQD